MIDCGKELKELVKQYNAYIQEIDKAQNTLMKLNEEKIKTYGAIAFLQKCINDDSNKNIENSKDEKLKSKE